MNMKKSLMLIAMALMAVSADAQTIAPTLVSEIDWTQRSDYYSNMWYSPDYCTVTVTKGEGLIIVSNPPSGADYWDSQVPVIGHIPSLTEGGNYVVKALRNTQSFSRIIRSHVQMPCCSFSAGNCQADLSSRKYRSLI